MTINFCVISDDFLKPLESFPMNEIDMELGDKASVMICMLNEVYKSTKDELKSYFSLNESLTLVSAYTSTGYDKNISDKEALFSTLNGAFIFEDLHLFFNVDKEQLIGKIERLSEFQAFTVIRMIFEVLYRRKESISDFDATPMVTEVFGVNNKLRIEGD